VQPSCEFVHGTAVAFGRHAVLLRGPSGAGKSDLALRCLGLAGSPLEEPRLVADDQVVLRAQGAVPIASPPERLKGLLEVRGLGIMPVEYLANAELVLVCDLVDEAEVPRMPAEIPPSAELAGCLVPLMRLAAFHASTPLKLRLAVAHAAANLRKAGQDRTCA